MGYLAWASAFCVVVVVLTLVGYWGERRAARRAEAEAEAARIALARHHAKRQLAEFTAKLTRRP